MADASLSVSAGFFTGSSFLMLEKFGTGTYDLYGTELGDIKKKLKV
jgi:hypothetical protein